MNDSDVVWAGTALVSDRGVNIVIESSEFKGLRSGMAGLKAFTFPSSLDSATPLKGQPALVPSTLAGVWG